VTFPCIRRLLVEVYFLFYIIWGLSGTDAEYKYGYVRTADGGKGLTATERKKRHILYTGAFINKTITLNMTLSVDYL